MVDGIATAPKSHATELKEELIERTCCYAQDYFEARERFLKAAERLKLEHHALPIHAPSPRPEPLTIDVAVLGSSKPKSALVLSSGVHGVEGLFGSAVQLSFLEEVATHWQPPVGSAVVLIHAVNPFGYAWLRRFNEENVDLNRNFLLADEQYSGSPPLAATFRRAMTPLRRRTRFGMWTARMALLALRHGVNSFWETLPVGQYDFPDWLFFGGAAPAKSALALQSFLPTILDEAHEIVHLDFHTGLGKWADGQLLVSESEGLDNGKWWTQNFGPQSVTQVKSFTRTYEVRGGFGPWLRAMFPAADYHYATAEFGTYSAMRVIGALADELHWHGDAVTDPHVQPARRRLSETFVPRSRSWRMKTLNTASNWARHATHVLWPATAAAIPPHR
jgi:hypothetical protein